MILATRREVSKKELQRIHVPDEYLAASLDDFPEGYSGLSQARHYVDSMVEMLSEGIGFVLNGPFGSGKTRMACALLKRALEHSARGYFFEAARMSQVVIERVRDSELEDPRSVVELAEEADLLVLDDLGSEHATDFARGLTERLLRFRIPRHRATVITLNVVPARLREIYGAGLAELLTEAMLPVLVTGKNWRAERAEKLRKRFSN